MNTAAVNICLSPYFSVLLGIYSEVEVSDFFFFFEFRKAFPLAFFWLSRLISPKLLISEVTLRARVVNALVGKHTASFRFHKLVPEKVQV
jgi:hypothetical protein